MSTRVARRTSVLAVLGACAFLVSGFPSSLHGSGIFVALVLVVLDLALIKTTGGFAFRRSNTLDEREAALRDLAYRRGFRLLGLAVVIGLGSAYVGILIAVARGQGTFSQVDSAISGRSLVAYGELLLMMPSLVIAWVEPNRPDEDAAGRPRNDRDWFSLSVLTVPAIAAAWLLAIVWAPIQSAAASRTFSVVADRPGSTCRHFAAGRIVGAEFGATVGMHVEVCWNGAQAVVIGNPSLPPPNSDQIGPPGEPSLTACGTDNIEDFALVRGMSCTAVTDSDGTLHYSVHARVAALPFSFGTRDVDMRLVVARDGRILEQP